MTKLQTLSNDAPLDLSNENVVKMVIDANVDNQKVESRVEPTPELPTGKTTTFTLKLETFEVANLIRQAEASNKSWKQFLTERIREDVLSSKVGKAVISQPSTMSSRISGVTNSVRRG